MLTLSRTRMGVSTRFNKTLKRLSAMTDKSLKASHDLTLTEGHAKKMKVELTVIAEFPPDVTYGKVKKLAQNLGHSKALRASTLPHPSICPSNGSPPRHQLKWEVPCIDTKDIASNSVFIARKQMAAAHRIKLSRIIRRLE